MTDRVRPFSNGTEFMWWVDENCEHCTKGAVNCLEPHEWPTCPIEAALTYACCADGKIDRAIYDKLGFGDDWRCSEFDATPEERE